MGKRKRTKPDIETNVLNRSKRICCLCFVEDKDSSRKDGQIAHIDRDAANSSEHNLVYLCVVHHGHYDCRSRQLKGYTKEQIIGAREMLYGALERRDGSFVLKIKVDRPYDHFNALEQAEFIRGLKHLLTLGDVEVIGKWPGCIELMLTLSLRDADTLCRAAEAGKLLSHGILNVERIDVGENDPSKERAVSDAAELPAIEESPVPRCLVAMPFRETWSKRVYRAMEDVMRSIKVNLFTADTTERTSLKLATNFENQVRQADFVVADVTNLDPNVHIEIGFALASGKDVLLCTQQPKDVCAHLRGDIYIAYASDKPGLDELSRQLRLRLQQCIERARLAETTRKLQVQVNSEYTVTCFKDMTVARLEVAFARALERIDILTTNLSWLFKKPSTTRPSCWDAIVQAVRRSESLQLRILTLNPESETAAKRGRQLGFTPANFRKQLREALDEAIAFASKYPTSRVEVRQYDELPTQITFRIDDQVYTCIVGRPLQSRHYPILRFEIGSAGVQEVFLAHFLAVWKDARWIQGGKALP